MPRPKPDWSKYSFDGTYPLWVMCALSCDIDPDSIDVDSEADRKDPELAVFWLRVCQAVQVVKAGGLKAEPAN